MDLREIVADQADPYGITTGPDAGMWFTEMNADRIGRLAPDVLERPGR